MEEGLSLFEVLVLGLLDEDIVLDALALWLGLPEEDVLID